MYLESLLQAGFTLLQNYKVLKLIVLLILYLLCFTLLQNYKVLKLCQLSEYDFECFTLLQNYKVLKPTIEIMFL